MKKTIGVIALTFASMSHASAPLITNLGYTPQKVNLGQTQTFSFDYYNASKCYAKTSTGEIVYYSGAQQNGSFSWTSSPRTNVITNSFTVICEGSGGPDAEEVVTYTVKPPFQPDCIAKGSSGNVWYECGDPAKGQHSYKRVTNNSYKINDFQIHDDRVYWEVYNNTLKSYAYYTNNIYGTDGPRLVTQVAYYDPNALQLDTLKEFQVVNGRAIWRYLNKSGFTQGSLAYYSVCGDGGTTQKITETATVGRTSTFDDNIRNFKVTGNQFEWDFYDGFFNSITLRDEMYPYCKI